MMASNIKRIDIDMKELETILDRAREGTLDEEGYKKLKAALETLGYLTNWIGDKNMTIRRLRNLVFGPSTEKSKIVLQKLPAAAEPAKEKEAEDAATPAKDHEPREDKKPKGHGRNGASAYTGAKKLRLHINP
jgi:transposase